jgi:amino acid transporter
MINQNDADARKLAELGYKQEFDRKWSGFHNFAISFSIISILSGCFTTFAQAWNNGGPIAISIGWPIITSLIFIIGLCMSELVSAMPTAGGIYYWALKLGKPVHGWLTGWLNLMGLITVTAGVDYGFANFFVFTGSLYSKSFDPGNLKLIFIIFAITLLVHIAMNIWGAKIIHSLQGINVWVHVFGVAAIILIFILIPTKHQSASWVFTHQINNSGFSSHSYWFYVLPLGFLLTQYTITGFDASAHVSEETGQASNNAAKGLWQSIAYSSVAGWILLLVFLFAATDEAGITKGGGSSQALIVSALTAGWAKLVLIISCLGQFFCGMSCVTAGSRMLFAFSRDRAVPGHRFWTKLDSNRNPSNAAFGLGAAALIISIPAISSPVAFFAITSMAVIGLFCSFAIPIYLRWRQGDSFKQGDWNLGNKWRWMAPLSVLEIIIVSIYFIAPTNPGGVWWGDKFDVKLANYAPVAFLVVIGGAMIWWWASAHKTFKGAVRTLD